MDSATGSTFESLRENIYAEVANLISQNENRPHFLIELFRELQMLVSDYLRQRALYAIQDLVTRHLIEDDFKNRMVRLVLKLFNFCFYICMYVCIYIRGIHSPLIFLKKVSYVVILQFFNCNITTYGDTNL